MTILTRSPFAEEAERNGLFIINTDVHEQLAHDVVYFIITMNNLPDHLKPDHIHLIINSE